MVIDPGWDLLAFAAEARGLATGAISFRTIPTGRPNLPTPDDGVAVQIDPAAVRDFVGTLSEGTPAGTPPADAGATAPADGPGLAVGHGGAIGPGRVTDHRGGRALRQLIDPCATPAAIGWSEGSIDEGERCRRRRTGPGT